MQKNQHYFFSCIKTAIQLLFLARMSGWNFSTKYFSTVSKGLSISGLVLLVGNLNAQWNIVDLTGFVVNNVNSIHFVSSTKGFAATDFTDGFSFSNKILKTTDGGNSWSVVHDNEDYIFRDIHFFDADHGVVTGTFGGYSFGICRTSDGGNNWNCEFLSEYSILSRRLLFLDSQTGFVTGARPAEMENTLLKTTDGGATWNDVTPSNTVEAIYGIDFTSSLVGFAVGGNALFSGNGIVYKTTDGGETWTPTFTNSNYTFNDVYFINANKGYLLATGQGQGIMYRTNDGGDSWTEINIPDMDLFRDIHFVSSQEGYASGGGDFFTGSVILKTTDGGTTWQQVYSSLSFPITLDEIHHNAYANRLYVTGPGGYVYTDGVISSTFATSVSMGVSIGPNPTDGALQVWLNDSDGRDFNIELMDSFGRQLSIKNNIANSTTIDLSGYPTGVYHIQVTDSNGASSTSKVVVKQ